MLKLYSNRQKNIYGLVLTVNRFVRVKKKKKKKKNVLPRIDNASKQSDPLSLDLFSFHTILKNRRIELRIRSDTTRSPLCPMCLFLTHLA